jgi:hypothetical protein
MTMADFLDAYYNNNKKVQFLSMLAAANLPLPWSCFASASLANCRNNWALL